MVRRGWTQIEVPAGWTQIIRGRRPPSVQWPNARQETPKRNPSATSKVQAPRQQSTPKDPVKARISRFEAALKALGQEQSDARVFLEEALKKAKTEAPSGSRDTTSHPPEVSVAEANAKVARLECSLSALGPDDAAERRVLEEALTKVRARTAVAPVGQRLDDCEQYCERAAKRLEKAQETVAEALKAQTHREEELAEGKRRLEALRAEAAAQPVPQPTIPTGTDELTHLRSQVAQLEGELRKSHRLSAEKSTVQTIFKRQVDILLQEVAALKVRVPQVSQPGAAEVALVPISRSGFGLMSDLIEEVDKKRLRVSGSGQ